MGPTALWSCLGLLSQLRFLYFKGSFSVKCFGAWLKEDCSLSAEDKLVPPQVSAGRGPTQLRSQKQEPSTCACGWGPRHRRQGHGAVPAELRCPPEHPPAVPMVTPRLTGSQAGTVLAARHHSFSHTCPPAPLCAHRPSSHARVSSPSALSSHSCRPLLPPGTSWPLCKGPTILHPTAESCSTSPPNKTTFPRARQRP